MSTNPVQTFARHGWRVFVILRKILIGVGLFAGGVWALNSSVLAGAKPDAETRLLSHRGVHQTYDNRDIGYRDCTAVLIETPTHAYLENTLDSMRAAFSAGAAVVELDIYRTKDGNWAVFHDYGLECRTDGEGHVWDHDVAELKALDIGYGYTADEGETYPFRGKYVGAMPMLSDVFDAFPDRAFLVNLKSNNSRDGQRLAATFAENPDWLSRVFGIYGGPIAIEAALDELDGVKGFSRASLMDCLKAYMAYGWIGFVPESCHDTQLLIPVSHARWLWGWPHKFTARMEAAGTDVILSGVHSGRAYSTGIDDAKTLARVPEGFDGYIWTNKIEEIGPLLLQH